MAERRYPAPKPFKSGPKRPAEVSTPEGATPRYSNAGLGFEGMTAVGGSTPAVVSHRSMNTSDPAMAPLPREPKSRVMDELSSVGNRVLRPAQKVNYDEYERTPEGWTSKLRRNLDYA